MGSEDGLRGSRDRHSDVAQERLVVLSGRRGELLVSSREKFVSPEQPPEGIDREILGKLNSPIDIILLRRFAGQKKHMPGEPVWEIMRMIGTDLIDYIRSYRARIDFVQKHAKVWMLESAGTPFKALFMPRTEPLPE